MKINFKTKDVDLNNDIRNYAEEKFLSLSKLINGVSEEDISFEIGFEKEKKSDTGEVFRCDATVLFPGNRTHAVGHGETMFSAIDIAKDELSRRLRRGKGKYLDIVRRGGAQVKEWLRWNNVKGTDSDTDS